MEEIQTNANCIVKAFESHDINIFSEEIENKKQYYFRANDVGKILDIVNIHVSIKEYDEDEMVLRNAYDHRGNEQLTKFLTSRGVYRLLYTSRKPIAKRFRKWVGDILDDIIFNDSNELKKQLAEKEEQLKIKELELEKQINEMKDMDTLQWQNIVLEAQMSLTPYRTKINGIYRGAYKRLHEVDKYANKVGKTYDDNGRRCVFNASSNPTNPFIMNEFKIYHGLESISEKILHGLLEPLNMKSKREKAKEKDKNRSRAKEHFMVSKKWLNYFIDSVLTFMNEKAEEVNEVIEIIEKHERNFDKAIKEMDDMFEETEEETEEEIKEVSENKNIEQLIQNNGVFDLTKKELDKKRKKLQTSKNVTKKCAICMKRFPMETYPITKDGNIFSACTICYDNRLQEFKNEVKFKFDEEKNTGELGTKEIEKMTNILKEIELVTYQDIYKKKALIETKSYKRCSKINIHVSELDAWKPKTCFGYVKGVIRAECRDCRYIQSN